MKLKYIVYFDDNGWITGFDANENGQYEFDADTLELGYLNAYKMIDGVPVIDLERKAWLIEEMKKLLEIN